jgi:hypothetical protein
MKNLFFLFLLFSALAYSQNYNLNINLKTGSTVTFSVDNIQRLDFGGVANTFQLSVDVTNGWNMVSVPGLNSPDQNVDTWWAYRNLSANVFMYNNGYQPVTITEPSTGYWMKNNGARTYNTGDEWPAGGIQIVTHNPIPGTSGWNLIGGYENSVSTAGITTIPAGLISGPVYRYSGGYQVATTLDPGYSYWIKLTGAGQIIIPDALIKNDFVTENFFNDNWGKIIITDNSGKSFTLYSVNADVDLNTYDLPPLPPNGIFDVRYSTGRVAENLNSFQSVELQGIEYPINIRVENISIVLQDESGTGLNKNLNPGEETILNNDIGLVLVKLNDTSAKLNFQLGQNYPNPFNPSTLINYQIPNDALVKLKVYDPLGKEIITLVNEQKDAGSYSVNFNAQEFSSGVYFYTLQAGDFVSIKKMILIK